MLCNSVGFHVLHSFHLTKSEIKVVNSTIPKFTMPQEVAMFTCAVGLAFFFFLIGIVDPLGTGATNRPIVPAPGDYDAGEICGMIGRGN
jgi:hypothetical protein